jgi:hypothetical protein
MQFSLRDLKQDVLCISVFDQDMYSPNGMQNIIALKEWGLSPIQLCRDYFTLSDISDKFPLHGASAIPFNTRCFISDFLGRTEVPLASLLKEGKGPWEKRLLLHEVSTGELLVRLELQLYKTTK